MAKPIRVDRVQALIKPSCDCRDKRQTVWFLLGCCKLLKWCVCGKVILLLKKEASNGKR